MNLENLFTSQAKDFINRATVCTICMYAKQKHPGCKKVRGQSEAALQIGTYVRPKTLIPRSCLSKIFLSP